MQNPMTRTLIVTACDENHYELGLDLITSLRDLGLNGPKVAFVDMGTGRATEQLVCQFDLYERQTAEAGQYQGFKVAFLSIKPRLPTIFPGFDTYIWIDADCWVQNASVIDKLVDAAQNADIAAHPELDAHYFRYKMPGTWTINVYKSLYGNQTCDMMCRFPMMNSGVFSARSNSKLWAIWSNAMGTLKSRWKLGTDLRFSDQIPLHFMIHTNRLSMFPLRAVDNWLLQAARPLIDTERKRVVVPSPPYEEINIIHLMGGSKKLQYYSKRLQRNISYRYRDIKQLFSQS
jgi:hypothetical protein